MELLEQALASLGQLMPTQDVRGSTILASEGGIGSDYLLVELTTERHPTLKGTLALGFGYDREGARVSFHAIHKGEGLWELEWYRSDGALLRSLPESLQAEDVRK